jgi:hypothetical protein
MESFAPHKLVRAPLAAGPTGCPAARAAKIVEGAKGKRLQYQRPDESPLA